MTFRIVQHPGSHIDVHTRDRSDAITGLMTSPVVKAKPADRSAVIGICAEGHADNEKFPLSVSKLEAAISGLLEGDDGVIGLIRNNSEIEAVMILQVSQPWSSDQYCLEEIFNFVRPRYRRSTNAKSLIAFAKRCSDEIGIPLVASIVSNEDTIAKSQLYERQLGKSCGGFFVYSKQQLPAALARQSTMA